MPKEELDAVIVKVCEVLPWLGDCIEEAEAMKLGEPKSYLSKLKNPDE